MTWDSPVVSAAPYEVGKIQNWDDFAGRIESYAEAAVKAGSGLMVLPEYAALDLGATLAESTRGDFSATCAALQSHMQDYRNLHKSLAQLHRLWVIAGSIPCQIGQDAFLNRAWIYDPSGREFYQDKIILTRFERSTGVLRGGEELMVFEAPFGRFGVNICYDSEFPLLARLQAESGMQLLVVPSDTDTPQGHHRVKIGCQARALENQIAVLHCPLLGNAPWSPAIDVNVGAAALYGPPDVGFPDNGVLAESDWNSPQLLTVPVPWRRVNALRRHGHVANFNDWKEQHKVRIKVH
jgi:predicted amidohydrolase